MGCLSPRSATCPRKQRLKQNQPDLGQDKTLMTQTVNREVSTCNTLLVATRLLYTPLSCLDKMEIKQNSYLLMSLRGRDELVPEAIHSKYSTTIITYFQSHVQCRVRQPVLYLSVAQQQTVLSQKLNKSLMKWPRNHSPVLFSLYLQFAQTLSIVGPDCSKSCRHKGTQ